MNLGNAISKRFLSDLNTLVEQALSEPVYYGERQVSLSVARLQQLKRMMPGLDERSKEARQVAFTSLADALCRLVELIKFPDAAASESDIEESILNASSWVSAWYWVLNRYFQVEANHLAVEVAPYLLELPRYQALLERQANTVQSSP